MKLRMASTCIAFFLLLNSICGAERHHTVRFSRGYSTDALNGMRFSEDDGLLAVSTSRGLSVVDVATGDIVFTCKDRPTDFAFSSNCDAITMVFGRKIVQQSVLSGSRTEKPLQGPGDIGIVLKSKNGKLLIAEVLIGSPADKSKSIHPGHEVIAFGNGPSGHMSRLVGLLPGEASYRMRGQANTSVRLETVAKGELKSSTHELVRRGRFTRGNKVQFVEPQKGSLADPLIATRSGGEVILVAADSGLQAGRFHATNMDSSLIDVSDSGKCVVLGQVASSHKERFLEFDEGVAQGERDIDGPTRAFVYDLANEKTLARFPALYARNESGFIAGQAFTAIGIDASGQRVAVAARQSVMVYSAETGKLIHEHDYATIKSLSVGRLKMIIGDAFSRVRLVSIETGKTEFKFDVDTSQESEVAGVAISPTEKWIAFYANGVLHVVENSEFKNRDNDDLESRGRPKRSRSWLK